MNRSEQVRRLIYLMKCTLVEIRDIASKAAWSSTSLSCPAACRISRLSDIAENIAFYVFNLNERRLNILQEELTGYQDTYSSDLLFDYVKILRGEFPLPASYQTGSLSSLGPCTQPAGMPEVPPGELCSCDGAPPWKLMTTFSRNSIYCMCCNSEIALTPSRLDESARDAVAYWNDMYRSVYLLWLDSSDCEAWATEQLQNTESRVNILGRRAQSELNRIHRTYYWWHQDESRPWENCPICRDALVQSPVSRQDLRVCEKCLVVTG